MDHLVYQDAKINSLLDEIKTLKTVNDKN